MKKTISAFLLAGTLLASCADQKQQIRIACLGDSITEGYGLKTQSKTSYPAVLNSLLGDDYIVQNCGRGGATLQREDNNSIWSVNEFSNAISLQPNIVVIKLGTNDTKTICWNQTRFKTDYQALIDTLSSLKTKPRIILCKPVPAFDSSWTINDSIIKYGVIPVIDEIALRNKLEVIDLYDVMKADSSNFPDNIHPDEIGANKMAHIIYDQIKGNKK